MNEPFGNASALTNMFIDYCAIFALKLSIAHLTEEDKNHVKADLIKRWEDDTKNLFENQKIMMKDAVKYVAAENKIAYLNALDSHEKKYEKDHKMAKDTILKLIGYDEKNKNSTSGG